LDVATARSKAPNGSVDALVRLAAADMRGVDALITARLDSPVPVIPALAEHLIAAGGKRLRPLLTVAAARRTSASTEPFGALLRAVATSKTSAPAHDAAYPLGVGS
jgi:octaprenyl-diphosphate synthase